MDGLEPHTNSTQLGAIWSFEKDEENRTLDSRSSDFRIILSNRNETTSTQITTTYKTFFSLFFSSLALRLLFLRFEIWFLELHHTSKGMQLFICLLSQQIIRTKGLYEICMYNIYCCLNLFRKKASFYIHTIPWLLFTPR